MRRVYFVCLIIGSIVFCCGFDGCGSQPPVTKFSVEAYDAPAPTQPLPDGAVPAGAIRRPLTLVWGNVEADSINREYTGNN